MSIYCSRVTVGEGWPAFEHLGVVAVYPGNDLRKVTRRGWPRDGAIHTAHIPHWCVPGHDEGDGCRGQNDDQPVAEWLRLSVGTAGTDATVLMDRAAVEALRDDLTAWLALDHVPARANRRTP